MLSNDEAPLVEELRGAAYSGAQGIRFGRATNDNLLAPRVKQILR